MNIIDLSEQPAECIRVCRRTRTVAEIYFAGHYKLCVTMKTLERIGTVLHCLVQGRFNEMVIPLRGDRYLYIGTYRDFYFISLECLNEEHLHLFVTREALAHFNMTAQSVLRYPSGTVLKSLLGVIAKEAVYKTKYGTGITSYMWTSRESGKFGRLGRMGID
jgi:hypothetical protein